MRFQGHFNEKKVEDVNLKLLELKGFLDESESKRSLIEFLKGNINYTVELLSGQTLFPFQEMMIRGMESKTFFLAIAGRAASKTWCVAMFCWLHCLWNPGANIGIISASFRQSRHLFEYIEKFAANKNAELLSQCIAGEVSHRADAWTIKLGSSKITALPLGLGQKIRGFRFSVIIADELLLIPGNIINEVVLPFLAANSDPILRKKITEEEDDLIAKGVMKNSERTPFGNNKFIGISSASYTFEFLYKLYEEYVKNIYDPNPRDDFGKVKDTTGYGVMQLSYEVAPKFIYNEDNLTKFKSQMSDAQFNREFGSVFTDDSGGFFSKKKMDFCTVENGKEPTIEIRGKREKEYILSIDPSWSKSESSDHFAMGVFSLDDSEEKLTLVHNYAVSGGNFEDHLAYLAYILEYFNIVYIICDDAGKWFLEDANSSVLFRDKKLLLNFFEADFENPNYEEGVRKSRREFNPQQKRICQAQRFSNEWITKANERLSAMFDHRNIRFASQAMDDKFKDLMKTDIPIDSLVFDVESRNLEGSARKAEFIEHQGEMINLVKSETALIEVSVTDTGKLTFKLPQNIKRDTSPTRARRDSYTALLLGSWGYKCYKDMTGAVEEPESFIPFFAA